MTCVEIGGFQDNVMANLLGSGGLLVTVSSIIYPFTHSPNGTNAASNATCTSKGTVTQYLHGSQRILGN